MTIHFAGNEEGSVNYGPNTTSSEPYIDAAFSRYGAYWDAYSDRDKYVVVDVPTFGANSPDGWWAHARYYQHNDEEHNSDYTMVVFSEGELAARFRWTSRSEGELEVWADDGTSNVAPLGGYSAGVQFLDLHCCTEDGEAHLRLYRDNVMIGHVSVAGTNRSLSGVQFGRISSSNNWSGDDRCGASEFIVADEDTRGMRVKTIVPTADGSENDWQGNFEAISNEKLDASAISTSDNNAVSTFTSDDLTDMGSTSFAALFLSSPAASASPDGLKSVVKVDGAILTQSMARPLTRATRTNWSAWTENPTTGKAFTSLELQGLEFGVKNEQ